MWENLKSIFSGATGSSPHHATSAEMFAAFARHRRGCLVAYWSVLVPFFGCVLWRTLKSAQVPYLSNWWTSFITIAILMGLFFVSQWIFLRCVRAQNELNPSNSGTRRLVACLVFALAIGTLGSGFTWAFVEMIWASGKPFRALGFVTEADALRLVATHPWATVGILGAGGIVSFLIALLAAQTTLEKPGRAFNLCKVMFGLSWLVAWIAGAVEVGSPSARQEISGSRFVLWVSTVLVFWAVGLMLRLVSDGDSAEGPKSSHGATQGINSSPYVALARNYSFVILVVVYAAFSATQAHLRRVGLLAQARQELAKQIVLNTYRLTLTNVTNVASMQSNLLLNIANFGAAISNSTKLRTLGLVTARIDTNLVRFSCGFPIPRGLKDDDSAIVVRVATSRIATGQSGDEVWQSTIYLDDLKEKSVKEAIDAGFESLRDIYQKAWGASSTNTNDYVLLYRDVEFKLQPPRAELPGVGLQFGSQVAPLVFAIVVIGLLVQIRSQARRIALDPRLALDQPWLVIDGREGLERFVAVAWVAALAAAPWIANACLLAFFAGDSVLNGGRRDVPQQVVLTVSCFVLFGIGGRASLTVTAELARLRRWRLKRIDAMRGSLN